MIFADYWVCTVITTVGYGDYTGGTSLEYVFTFGIEFFGFVIFAALQIAILQILKVESSFASYVSSRDFEVLMWLRRIEKSGAASARSMPHRLYHEMRSHLYWAGRRNYDVVTEFGFYQKLPPNLQTELIKQLFGTFLKRFASTFEGCECAFVNRIVVSLSYKSFEHNTVFYRGRFEVREAYFVMKGGVAVCESTCYKEPITVYGPGAFILLY
mmetsp:Transcript_35460/g.46675  ORF Transcript_35460/g.46675 Transcript_35460/m.46675 type:complete len:213 (+) Transcript_35460:2-640(+)